jgi:hypothetical protein
MLLTAVYRLMVVLPLVVVGPAVLTAVYRLMVGLTAVYPLVVLSVVAL